MTQEELKTILELLEELLQKKRNIIDLTVDSLNKQRGEHDSLLRSYMETDRELALLDGRFKLIELRKSGQKTKKTISQLLAKMSNEQKAQLWEDLRGSQG